MSPDATVVPDTSTMHCAVTARANGEIRRALRGSQSERTHPGLCDIAVVST